jgi:hypothetical protein
MFSTPVKISVNQAIFNATTWANMLQNAASPATALPIALHITWPGRAGTQSSGESNYTNYARATPLRTAAGYTVNGTTGRVTLTSAVSFPASSASGNDQYAHFFSIGDGAGNIIQAGCLVLSGTVARPFVAVTSGTITCPAHGAPSGQKVAFFAAGDASLPTGIVEGTVYFVRSDVTTDTMTVASTSGGASIAISAAGGGILMVLDPPHIQNNSTITLTAATAVVVD